MSDLLKLLDGSVDDVKAGLAGLSREDLAALRAAEKDGKTRKGVLEALDELLDADETTGGEPAGAADIDMSHPAVDPDPRANTTDEQNRIDFNDPTLSGQDAVERNLANQ